MSARETQFAGFAKAVVEELLEQRDGVLDYSAWWQSQAEQIIAARAYDLVCHACSEVTGQAEHVGVVSDLPMLPVVLDKITITPDSQLLDKSDAERRANAELIRIDRLLVRLEYGNACYQGAVYRFIPKESEEKP